MKKLTSLLALFLVCLGITANAQNVVKNIGTPILSVDELTDGATVVIKSNMLKKCLYPAADNSIQFKEVVTNGTTEAVWTVHKTGQGKTAHFSFSSYDQPESYVTAIKKGKNIQVAATAGEFTISYTKGKKVYLSAVSPSTNRWIADNTGFLKCVNKTQVMDSNGSCLFDICPVSVGQQTPKVSVTYVYKMDGVEKKRETVDAYVGDPCSVKANDYLTYAFEQDIIPADGGEIVVNCTLTEALPIEFTTDLAQAKWYNIKMHGSRLWKYDATDNAIYTVVPGVDENTNVDAYKWCFVGNVVAGFKLCNKLDPTKAILAPTATASSMVFNPATLVAAETASTFYLYQSDKLKGQNCFSVDGRFFLNNQKIDDVNPCFLLKYSETRGPGSSCSFVALDEDGLKIKEFLAIWEPLEKLVGGYNESTLALVKKATTYAEVEEILSTATKNAVDVEAYYRLSNVGSHQLLSVNGGNLVLKESAKDDINNIWQLQQTAEGQYVLYNPNYAKSIQVPGNNTLDAASAVYRLTDMDLAEITLESAGQYLSVDANGVVGEATATANAHWYLEPVEQIGITLHPEDDATAGSLTGVYWATICLPFNANCGNVAAKLTCYGVEKVVGNSAVLTPIEGITANQGVILQATGKQYSFQFKIGKNATRVTPPSFENLLQGSNVEMAAPAASYVLGKGSQGIGLYRPMGGQLMANRAYLIYNEPAAVNGLNFVFGEVTGVDEVETATESAVYYDLSGRRVAQPTHGIYVKNGKKVFVK